MKNSQESLSEILEKLDREVLVRLILNKAEKDSDFEQAVRNAALGKDEVVEEIKAEIAVIKRSRCFYDWRSSDELYEQLENILNNISQYVKDSEKGIELLSKFFNLDQKCCENCDDSDGGLGYEFNTHAVEVMIPFAKDYSDKTKLTEIVYDLLKDNGYGCHDGILKSISEILPAENIRSLLDRDFESHSYVKRDLAFALNDAPFFEKLLKEYRPNGFSEDYDYPELCECYLNYGDTKKALEYADLIPFHNSKKNELYEKIYLKTNDIEGLKKIYVENYLRYPEDDTKRKIIELFGNEFFESVRNQRIQNVMNSSSFSETDMLFLIDNNLKDQAEEYFLKRKDKIADMYFQTDFIKKIKKNCSPLVQTVIVRVPLNYYLDNAKSTYYSTAAKHLIFLCKTAPSVTDWKDVQPHKEYLAELKQKHYRKYAFWKYFK